MNEKVMLNITLPATRRSYDFNVPRKLTIHETANLVAEILANREPDYYHAGGNAALMDKQTGTLLDPRSNIRESDLKNGSQLVLV